MNDLLSFYERDRGVFLIEIESLNQQYDGSKESAMKLAYYVAHKYSTCRLCGVGKGVGVIVIEGDRIVDFGYNGVALGIPSCTKETCIRRVLNIPDHTQREMCYGDCAEKKAIANACRYGINLVGTTIFVTKSPCVSCTKLLIDVGIKQVIYHKLFSQPDFSMKLIEMANVGFEQVESPDLALLSEQ